jgi:hypothetical protein
MPERNMDLDRTSSPPPPPPSKLPPPATTPSAQATHRAKRPNELLLSNNGYGGGDDDRRSHNDGTDQRDALLLFPLSDEALLPADAANVEYPVQANGHQPVVIPVAKHKYEATIIVIDLPTT